MDQAKSRLHPLVATAAIGVILACAAAIAAITGVLPGWAQKSESEPQPAASAKSAPIPPPPPQRAQVASAQPPVAKAHCANCGVVVDVKEVEVKGQGSGVGAVAGGVVGAVVGNQFGHGTGNTVMTVAGAAGGALAGNEIEKRAKTHKRYDVAVRMGDGSTQMVAYDSPPTWRSGDHVRVANGRLEPQ